MLLTRVLKLRTNHWKRSSFYKLVNSCQQAQSLSQKISENNDESSRKMPRSVDLPGSDGYKEVMTTARVLPMLMTKEPVVLPFDSVPGPKTLKYFCNMRQYISELGTQLTAAALTTVLNIGTYINKRKSLKNLSTLFDEYGPVVRFVSPVGGDVVLITHPDHIQKVYTMEGDYPVRSSLDSLEKYRKEHRSNLYGGLYNVQGKEWDRHKTIVTEPFYKSVSEHMDGLLAISDLIADKINNLRNHQDEIPKDLHREVHKWAFDSIGLVIFSKRFNMLETEVVSSQCDESWLYHSFANASDAVIKCETGLKLWKIISTPSWLNLVKHCDSLDSLIGKYVLECEQTVIDQDLSTKDLNINDLKGENRSLIISMLMSEEKMSPEDISTVLMDMLLIGVNTISSSMSFLMFYLAKYQRCQKLLHQEISKSYPNGQLTVNDIANLKENTPYLQACIKEALRLVPPIPVLTRILPKNIILDRYNIPRGTLIMMSTMESSLKEGNYDDADKFFPERWLGDDVREYHAFASIPFGYGTRKCLGQNVAETMLSILTIKLVQKFKLEYHYGDIEPTRSFIAKPNKALKIRFTDRI